MSKKVSTVIIGILIGFTSVNLFILLMQYMSTRLMTETYRWYRVPQPCIKSTHVLGDMVDLVTRSNAALEKLGISAPVCYGTLWGVLRHNDILPWDNNVDLCVMNEHIRNVSFSLLQKEFSNQGVLIHAFSLSLGTYRIERGLAEGHINVFFNCTDIKHLMYPDHNIPTVPGEEVTHWACAYSLVSLVGKLTHDFNRPFPSWILTPPFQEKKLATTKVQVPHDSFEMQKYLYPDDWWLEVKPFGCL